MTPIIITIVVFVGVAALVGGVAMSFRKTSGEEAADRLDILTGASSPKTAQSLAMQEGVLSQPLDERPGFFEAYVARFFNITLLLEQANVSFSTSRLFAAMAIFAVVAAIIPIAAGQSIIIAPIAAIFAAPLPLLYVIFKKRRRMKKFAGQMPAALELIARALRSGHSLASGFNLVASEMSDPIASEFMRVFEEQNLGIALEDSLEEMTERVPNLDLKFFSTAVILQRQTGGDLAEILDKIGYIIRERFKIFGQVQALTGEGRLSGIVLLSLPPVLFLAVYQLNPEYISVLFTEDMGKKMLAGAAVMQVIGALVIRKIINIKV